MGARAREGLTNARDSLIERAVAQNPSRRRARNALSWERSWCESGNDEERGRMEREGSSLAPLLINEAGWPRLKMPSHRRGPLLLSPRGFSPRDTPIAPRAKLYRLAIDNAPLDRLIEARSRCLIMRRNGEEPISATREETSAPTPLSTIVRSLEMPATRP